MGLHGIRGWGARAPLHSLSDVARRLLATCAACAALLLVAGGADAQVDAQATEVAWRPMPPGAVDVLVKKGSDWRFLDNGVEPGPGWRFVDFDDSTWGVGPAQLGFGEGDEATLVSFGDDPQDKIVTTYFRKVFVVDDPSAYQHGAMRLLHDAGASVFLNGLELARSNLPIGTLGVDTLAKQDVVGLPEKLFFSWGITPWPEVVLQNGPNVLAVEVHLASKAGIDKSFDLELLAVRSSPVTRGPYLQMATPTSVVVRWRTKVPTTSRVRFGTRYKALEFVEVDAVPTIEHEVLVDGLLPGRKYYYAIGSDAGDLLGDDADHAFSTPPPPGTGAPVRIWVIGDSGTADASAWLVDHAYDSFTGPLRTDAWLLLGDNAYQTGTDDEYQKALFDMYTRMLRRTSAWPARGNHDLQEDDYLGMFTLPTQGEAGGVASGSESFYSFDHANVHLVCLDSFGSDRSVGGPMWQWLRADLATTTEEWTIAYWHHPPYSKGSHDSDNPKGLDTELQEMRENFLPLLEQAGVDLVLSGHSHSYERSYLIDGHYGDSTTFDVSMLVDAGDGSPEGDGAYVKTPTRSGGTVYCVAGSSGSVAAGNDLDHPVMAVVSDADPISLVIEVQGQQLDAQAIDIFGAVVDAFRIVHVDELSNADLLPSGEARTPVPQLRSTRR